MQALVELIAGFIAMLAAVALSQFGVDLNPAREADREVHRVAHCDDVTVQDAKAMTVTVEAQDC
ncbi:hypothetical protein [Brevundimonas sp.]|uniref:hypothetical protein n=1 Tax=Brevundimonas sp. TaxID=1871086 RepID=UPI002FDB1850